MNYALWYAARGDDWEKVEALISKGADVNAKDNNGQTPLYNMAREKKNEVVALLQAAVQKQEKMAALLQATLQNQA